MISVIVPCYNGEKKIKRCLESLLNQTYDDFEVIVIDDGSIDGTVVAVMSLSDPRIKLVSQTNAGVGAARNRGIDEAKGSLIAFVDSDDYVERTYLKTLLSLYSEGGLAVVGFSKNELCEPVLRDRARGKYVVGNSMPEEYLIGELGNMIGFSCWNKLFSKQVLDDCNIRFEVAANLGEDMVFVLRYLCHCRFVLFDETPQYHYCDNSNSATHVAKDQSESYEITLKVISQINENRYHVSKSVLSAWSLQAMMYVLSNPYVSKMSFLEFRTYWNRIKSYSIVLFAIQGKSSAGFKQTVMAHAMEKKLPLLLYFLIKGQRLLERYVM